MKLIHCVLPAIGFGADGSATMTYTVNGLTQSKPIVRQAF
jgi:hypothetical protein